MKMAGQEARRGDRRRRVEETGQGSR